MFSLFLLNKYGDDYKLVNYYTDLYIKAFPIFLQLANEKELRFGYEVRFVKRFAVWFGFAVTKIDETKNILEKNIMIKKSNLLKVMLER